ncbi:MAG: hypothetical protein H8E42_12205 [Nitrospinae bacterium]|nr:hypothetical protein [Nitrospinota bacterium]MBL7020762.1 hypothetical protein [Nitrospinaceae bacterium]
MSKKVTLNIEPDLYQHLEHRFKDDEQGLKQFIIDAIRIQLKAQDSLPEKKDDLESYLQKGSSGSRTYGVKGQGW